MCSSERIFMKHSLMVVVTMVTMLCGAVHSQGTCPQFSLTSPPMGTYSCPGSIITYTCVLSSSAPLAVITIWKGSAFQCPSTNHRISLTQLSDGVVQQFIPGSCGSLSAVTTNVTSTCYTSVLTIPAVQALNGTTVVCGDGNTGAVVGNDILKIITTPGPVGNMTVTSPSVDQLTVTWTPPTPDGVPTSYNVTINDSSSPVVIADNGSPVYNHTFTGLVSDTLYTVSVVAINCAGSSNGTSNIKRTRPAPPIRTSMQMVLVFNPNNTLRHLEISWIPLGGSVSVYTVRVVGDGGTSVGHGSTKCTTSPCLFVQQVNVPATSYTIFVASINGDGEEGPENNITVSGTNTSSSVLNCAISTNTDMGCTFNQSFYCMVCCSTDPSVPPDSSVYNISTTRGTEVTVSLQGLTSGQMYYCKAAATNTNSNNCTGPVVGGVKVFFSFISAGVNPSQMTTHPEDNIDAIIGGVVGSVVGGGIIIIIISIISIILLHRRRDWCSTSSYHTGEETTHTHTHILTTITAGTLQNSLRLTTKSSPDELFCEAVSEQAGQSHCGLGGGYKNIAVCRKTTTERHVPLAVASGTTVQQSTYSVPDRSKKVTPQEGGTSGRCAPIGGYDDIEVVRAVKLGGVASGDRMEPSAVATNTQQATYAIPDRTKKQTSFTSSPPSPPPPPPPKEGGAHNSRCAPIGGYDDIVVVRAVKLGGVASGDTMEPSAVATNTQQATYAVPDLTKKRQQVLSMADTPPPLPAPLKEGDDGLPMAIYALCGPATDDRDEGVAIGCGYLHGLTTSFEEPATADPYHTIPNRRMTNQSKTSDHAQITEGVTLL